MQQISLCYFLCTLCISSSFLVKIRKTATQVPQTRKDLRAFYGYIDWQNSEVRKNVQVTKIVLHLVQVFSQLCQDHHQTISSSATITHSLNPYRDGDSSSLETQWINFQIQENHLDILDIWDGVQLSPSSYS